MFEGEITVFENSTSRVVWAADILCHGFEDAENFVQQQARSQGYDPIDEDGTADPVVLADVHPARDPELVAMEKTGCTPSTVRDAYIAMRTYEGGGYSASPYDQAMKQMADAALGVFSQFELVAATEAANYQQRMDQAIQTPAAAAAMAVWEPSISQTPEPASLLR